MDQAIGPLPQPNLKDTNTACKTNLYDVTTGSNGANAGPGWDYCTGVGSPRGKLGK